MKQLGLVCILSFFLNIVWEYAHAPLYVSYKGGPITHFILFHASLGDALLLTLLALPFCFNSFFRTRLWLIVPLGLFVAVLVEYYGLQTGRLVYAESMPIVPLLKVGLTPFVQLALTGTVSYTIVLNKKL